MIQWIDESLDRLGVERAAFVGASMGTWMATRYAIARPDRVERLALVGPSGIVSSLRTGWLLRAFTDVIFRPSSAKIEAFVESLVAPETRKRMRTDPWHQSVQLMILGIGTFRRGLREPLPLRCNVEPLADSGIPVLAIIGREEALHDGPKMAERFRQRLPGVQVRLLDDANHLVFIDQQELVAEELRTFLGQ